MGMMKNRNVARFCRPRRPQKRKRRVGKSKRPLAKLRRGETVTLRKCGCGRQQFVLRFEMATIRYTIRADCIACGASRVISLDEAHKAHNQMKCRKQDHSSRSGPRRRPQRQRRRKVAVSGVSPATAGCSGYRAALAKPQTLGHQEPLNPGTADPGNLVGYPSAKADPGDASPLLSPGHR